MSYDYETEKGWLFTDQGQRAYLQLHEWSRRALKMAGAFRALEAMAAVSVPDSWKFLALLDRMVELGAVREIAQGAETPSQYRLFVAKGLDL